MVKKNDYTLDKELWICKCEVNNVRDLFVCFYGVCSCET